MLNVLGITIERANYTQEQKERIVKQLLKGSDPREDFEKLRNNDEIAAFSPHGLDVVNTFTLIERLNPSMIYGEIRHNSRRSRM
jgi:hypothetical protein